MSGSTHLPSNQRSFRAGSLGSVRAFRGRMKTKKAPRPLSSNELARVGGGDLFEYCIMPDIAILLAPLANSFVRTIRYRADI